jgi:hypothetical protein
MFVDVDFVLYASYLWEFVGGAGVLGVCASCSSTERVCLFSMLDQHCVIFNWNVRGPE